MQNIKIMKVKKNTLLLFACFVWSIAGFNVCRIGLDVIPEMYPS